MNTHFPHVPEHESLRRVPNVVHNPCNCEHIDHFPEEAAKEFLNLLPVDKHVYLEIPAGNHKALYIGPICDDCANTCMKDYLITDSTEE